MRGPVSCLRVHGWKAQKEDQTPVLGSEALLLSGPVLCWHLRSHLLRRLCLRGYSGPLPSGPQIVTQFHFREAPQSKFLWPFPLL